MEVLNFFYIFIYKPLVALSKWSRDLHVKSILYQIRVNYEITVKKCEQIVF